MNAKDFLKALRTNKKLYAYVNFNGDCGGYMEQVKKAWIDYLTDTIKEGLNTQYDVNVNDKSIYLN